MTLMMEMKKQRNEGREEGRAEGRTEGRTEGEARFADLMAALFRDSRSKDAERTATDIEYRKTLYHEYHMDEKA